MHGMPMDESQIPPKVKVAMDVLERKYDDGRSLADDAELCRAAKKCVHDYLAGGHSETNGTMGEKVASNMR